MRLVEIPIYQFDELSEDAKNRAVQDEITAMLEMYTDPEEDGSEQFWRAVEECERLGTPWFIADAIWEYCQDEILEQVRQLEFYEDGGFFGHIE